MTLLGLSTYFIDVLSKIVGVAKYLPLESKVYTEKDFSRQLAPTLNRLLFREGSFIKISMCLDMKGTPSLLLELFVVRW